MFAADLSWTDPTDEKVGERKQRKLKEQSASSKASSVKSSRSSTRDSVWGPSVKKPKLSLVKTSKATKTDGTSEPNSVRKLSKVSKPHPQPLDLSLKDPAPQPKWTLASTLSASLPFGASLDLSSAVHPDPDRVTWSRHSNSSGSRYSNGKAHRKSFEKVIDEVHEIQQLSPKSFISRTTRRSSEVRATEKTLVGPVTWQENVKYDKCSYSVEIQGCLDLEQMKLDEEEPKEAVAQKAEDWPSYSNISPTLVSWKAPSEWEVILSNEPAQESRLSSLKVDSSTSADKEDLTHFQRFIRRMENAGSKIILDRLKEEWNEPVDEEADDELKLEKQLWVLTALQLQTLDKSLQPSQAAFGQLLRLPTWNHHRKILELYGNLAEVYQLSAMQPGEKIYYLSTKPQGAIPLPANVSYISVPQAGLLPFPYAALSFNHIRASSLPSLIPSVKLVQVFKECHRLLAPGGILEVRIMDASPNRKVTGPKLRVWMEDRLSLNLEKSFRCSRPCMLIPSWVKDAGFSLLNNPPATMTQTLRLRTAFDSENGTVNDELSTMVGRALWKDIWGDLVEDKPGEPRWWWEDEEIVKECLERKTVFECGTLFAFKE